MYNIKFDKTKTKIIKKLKTKKFQNFSTVCLKKNVQIYCVLVFIVYEAALTFKYGDKYCTMYIQFVHIVEEL